MEDIMSWGTRLKILWDMPGDKIAGKHDVENLIKDKFDDHLFSNAKLKKNLGDIFSSLQTDLQANHNLMLQEIRAFAAENEVPFNLPDVQAFGESVRKELLNVAKEQAEGSSSNGVQTVIVSGMAGYAGEQLAAQLLATVGTDMAATIAIAGGSTVTGAGGGAGIGALGGPGGAAIGIVAGFIVGGAADWWMSASFKNKTEVEMNLQIDRLRDALLKGRDGHEGLVSLLNRASAAVNKAQAKQMEKAFVFP